MNDAPNKSTPKRFAIAAVVVIAIAAGVIANKAVYRKNNPATDANGQTAAEKQQLDSLQATLSNTALFPINFRSIPTFSLTDEKGQAITETMFSDQWSMMFFGYTQCPDICPMTMTIMNSVAEKLIEQSVQPLQVVFVSVDPKRDTADKLGQYMNFFNPEFKGLTGELSDVLALTNELGIVASYSVIEGTEDYMVDHTASMLLVDPLGRVRAKFSAPHQPDTIVDDYKKIIATLN